MTSPYFVWLCASCEESGNLPTFVGAPFSVQMVTAAYALHDKANPGCHVADSLTIYAHAVPRPLAVAS